jgi:hypothetical protein
MGENSAIMKASTEIGNVPTISTSGPLINGSNIIQRRLRRPVPIRLPVGKGLFITVKSEMNFERLVE